MKRRKFSTNDNSLIAVSSSRVNNTVLVTLVDFNADGVCVSLTNAEVIKLCSLLLMARKFPVKSKKAK